MIIIVTGGRDFPHRDIVFDALDEVGPECVFHGRCPTGADFFADDWAAERGIPAFGCRALFGVYGPPAGPIRNGWLAKYAHADALVAFPGGRGTASMMAKAREHGIKVLAVEVVGNEGWYRISAI